MNNVIFNMLTKDYLLMTKTADVASVYLDKNDDDSFVSFF